MLLHRESLPEALRALHPCPPLLFHPPTLHVLLPAPPQPFTIPLSRCAQGKAITGRNGQNEILNFHLPISPMHCLHLDQWGWKFGAQLCPLGWPPEISEGTCWCGEEGDEVVCHLGNEQHWKSFGHLAESLRKAKSCSLQG